MVVLVPPLFGHQPFCERTHTGLIRYGDCSAGIETPAPTSEYSKHQPKVLSPVSTNTHLIFLYEAEQLPQYLNTQWLRWFQSSFWPLCQRREPKSGSPVTSFRLHGNTGQAASPLVTFCRAHFGTGVLRSLPRSGLEGETGCGHSWHDPPGTGLPGPPSTPQVMRQVGKFPSRPNFGQSCQVYPQPLMGITSSDLDLWIFPTLGLQQENSV